jgi:6-phosphogluconate dehydrogenase (decarboxylating)
LARFGGNSYYVDDIRRANQLVPKGIHYIDVGTSGGIWGLDRGYCMMIGGEAEAVKHLDPVFATLAPGRGDILPTPGREKTAGTSELRYLHCVTNGAGHFVKMVHNGIEYGLMAAYAEGLAVLKSANVGKKPAVIDAETTPLRDPEHYKYDLNLADVAEVWRRGSIVASWLLDLTATALIRDSALTKFAGRVSDSGEGRWTIKAAIDEGVPVPVLSSALYERFSSRGEDSRTNCSRPCATSSAGTSRSLLRNGLADKRSEIRTGRQRATLHRSVETAAPRSHVVSVMQAAASMARDAPGCKPKLASTSSGVCGPTCGNSGLPSGIEALAARVRWNAS